MVWRKKEKYKVREQSLLQEIERLKGICTELEIGGGTDAG